jgi:hypothetical protein
MTLNNQLVRVASRHNNESQVCHRNKQRKNCRLVPPVWSGCRSKRSGRLSIELPLKPESTEAVDEGLFFSE